MTPQKKLSKKIEHHFFKPFKFKDGRNGILEVNTKMIFPKIDCYILHLEDVQQTFQRILERIENLEKKPMNVYEKLSQEQKSWNNALQKIKQIIKEESGFE